MDVVAVFVGSFGLLGFLAFLFLLIFSIATKRSKALPAICMVVCLVLLGVGAVGFMMTRPGTDTSGNQSLDGSGDDSGMVEAGLFNVKLTVPAEYVEDGMTQEMLDEQVKESKMKEAKLNEDGSVTYTMSKSQHKELMKGIEEEINAGLSELENSEDYPSFVKIEANGDYTKYTVTVNTDELSLTESLSVLGFYLLSGTYHAFNGTQVDNVCVQFVNEATGEVIQEANSRDIESSDSPSETDGDQQPTESTESTLESDLPIQETLPDPIIYSGSGDDVIRLDQFDGVFVFHIIGNDTERHFSVKGFDSNGGSTELFVNTTSVYDGITIDPAQETVMLEVNAEGNWTIEMQSIDEMRTISSGETLSGTGDSVVRVSSYGNTATISGNADSRHFSVKSYGKTGDKLLVNTTDVYEGTVMLTGEPIILEVNAEGDWTISFE